VFELFETPIEGRVEVWTLNAADRWETPELAEPIVSQFVIDEMRELGRRRGCRTHSTLSARNSPTCRASLYA
jgi:hypothetical protein